MHLDPERDQFSVTTARPDAGAAAPGPAEVAALNSHADQICTRGYDAGAPGLAPAEADQQLVTMQLRCNHYDYVHFNPSRVDWSNLF